MRVDQMTKSKATYYKGRKNMAELQADYKKVIYESTSEFDLETIWSSVLEMARGGDRWAIQFVTERILGKTGVGETATLADQAAAQAMRERLAHMSEEELAQAYKLAQKIHGEDDGAEPNHILALPNAGENTIIEAETLPQDNEERQEHEGRGTVPDADEGRAYNSGDETP